MLWRWSPHLDFLFNPVAVIGLACVALAGCYYLGERNPTPLDGLRQRLGWAAFGTLQSLPTTHRRSPGVVLLTGTIVLSLMALIGYSHIAMARHLARNKLKSDYVVSQKDEWTVLSTDEVQVRSALAIQKLPERDEALVLHLPFQDAALKEVKRRNDALPFSRTGKGEYRVDLSSCNAGADADSITVLWGVPLACLTPDAKYGYQIPLKSLAPVGFLLPDGDARRRVWLSVHRATWGPHSLCVHLDIDDSPHGPWPLWHGRGAGFGAFRQRPTSGLMPGRDRQSIWSHSAAPSASTTCPVWGRSQVRSMVFRWAVWRDHARGRKMPEQGYSSPVAATSSCTAASVTSSSPTNPSSSRRSAPNRNKRLRQSMRLLSGKYPRWGGILPGARSRQRHWTCRGTHRLRIPVNGLRRRQFVPIPRGET